MAHRNPFKPPNQRTGCRANSSQKKKGAREFPSFCFSSFSPNLLPSPPCRPWEGARAALLLGCAGWGKQGRIPSSSPPGRPGNEGASHQAMVQWTQGCGKAPAPSPAFKSCDVLWVPQRVRTVTARWLQRKAGSWRQQQQSWLHSLTSTQEIYE